MRLVTTVLTLVVSLAVAGSLRAADEGKKAHEGKHAARLLAWAGVNVDQLNLTAEQKAKAADLQKEFGPKVAELLKKMQAIMTDDQRKARQEAEKAAKAAGKTGKELHDAVAAAVTLTDEQKAKQAEVKQEMAPIVKEAREKLMAILTPEQQAVLKPAKKAKKAQ
jgi:Spy/CpxP family protein refolding chaperone